MAKENRGRKKLFDTTIKFRCSSKMKDSIKEKLKNSEMCENEADYIRRLIQSDLNEG
jgi:hypothetical protein